MVSVERGRVASRRAPMAHPAGCRVPRVMLGRGRVWRLYMAHPPQGRGVGLLSGKVAASCRLPDRALVSVAAPIRKMNESRLAF